MRTRLIKAVVVWLLKFLPEYHLQRYPVKKKAKSVPIYSVTVDTDGEKR